MQFDKDKEVTIGKSMTYITASEIKNDNADSSSQSRGFILFPHFIYAFCTENVAIFSSYSSFSSSSSLIKLNVNEWSLVTRSASSIVRSMRTRRRVLEATNDQSRITLESKVGFDETEVSYGAILGVIPVAW